ncbi:MAG: NAD(P)H oxidoreductase [Nitrospirae bacterium]|nr:NAD(P)H oxidoreductase [Nitrospirota bacterium]NTW65236.1 NAD(P)H oxidoreductase [Nitrospirota bacterium]
MTGQPFAHRVLILFAHPALQKSRVNRQLVEAVRDLEGITFHDLYELYPDFHIDVGKEQDLLRRHDIIVFQYPLYWFSVPALLKMWQELVLEHRWAYGREGTVLRGKKLMSALSTGGRESLFCREGFNRCTIREYLVPVEQLARICGMEYLPPFVIHGTRKLTGPEIGRHAEDYRNVITAIRDDRINWEAAGLFPRLNMDLDAVIRK